MATIVMDTKEQKAMKANKTCPCCGASMTQKQVDHLMSSQDESVSESFRREAELGASPAELLHLVEAAEQRGGMTQEEKNYLNRRLAAHESERNVREYAPAWEALTGDPRVAEILARG